MKRKIGSVGSILTIAILIGCNSGTDTTKSNSVIDTAQVVSVSSIDSLNNSERRASTQYTLETEINRLHRAMASKDIETINSFIDSEIGVVFIPATGAMLQFNEYKSIKAEQASVFNPTTHNEELVLSYEPLPTPDCDSGNLYSKSGCFVLERNERNEDNLQLFREADESWKKTSLSLITHTVVNTNDFVYYVQYKEGKLKLIAINFRRPCNA